ncbi:BMP family lipoprotein [Vagococcus intermedius]|uniref:BMP family protein n=1 Tax=Vagococcus intermedius TaxID=2991418 RepID=A0AAF0CUT2_9ENTE|nr:BMP family protein [Vagococcus intermedius]WEG73359.1 BMP family protein [Vagococcus intermedius]WEG75440.1 BMP family protein [Vagococcus intermedius]
MKLSKKLGLGVLALGMTTTLVACGSNDDKKEGSKSDEANTSVALVTDLGGVDDKSFNQSAWEGLQAWGKANNLEKGNGGYNYYQSNSDSEFDTNINTALNDGFQTVFGIGFKLKPAIEAAAGANADKNFVLIDDQIDGKDNVASIVFKDNEAAYLAGIAAAMTTKSDKLGFIGGQEGDVIGRFEAGFAAGAKSVKKDIDVSVNYVGSFGDAPKGKAAAEAMYGKGIDVIYHASGDTGNGVFTAAKDIVKADKDKKVWVVGVDRDQEAEGKEGDQNVTLTSTLKGVSQVVQDLADQAKDGKFPGGDHLVYGLKEDGVDLTDGQLTDEIKEAVNKAKEDIKSGKVEVPEKPAK